MRTFLQIGGPLWSAERCLRSSPLAFLGRFVVFVIPGPGHTPRWEVCLMGNVVDFRKCESLDRDRQRLTGPELERLEELLGATGVWPDEEGRTGPGVRRR